MIIRPPIWWLRRERGLIRAATRRSIAKRKQFQANLAAQTVALKARGPELRKREADV